MQGGAPPGPELPAMAIADALFDEMRGTEHRAPELTDRHLEVLAFIFKENHLQNALELVQTGRESGFLSQLILSHVPHETSSETTTQRHAQDFKLSLEHYYFPWQP